MATNTKANDFAEPEIKTERTVRIKLPLTKEEKEPVCVWVNDRSWTIKRGVEVEVPECVAEVLQHQEDMLAVSNAFIEASENRN